MKTTELIIQDLFSPQLLVKAEDFLLVYKPPKMHSSPGKGKSLVEWIAVFCPELKDLNNERGLIHRLDYETQGLLLFSRNQRAFEKLQEEQAQGLLIKDYKALVSKLEKLPQGFPPYTGELFSGTFPQIIKSYFRPFGPGRIEVRPLEEGRDQHQKKTNKVLYCTEILEQSMSSHEGILRLSLRINRGFRHQLRCHLAWAGFPILNDPLYSKRNEGKGFLGLRAEGIQFVDPSSGEPLRFVLPPLVLEDV